MKSEARFRKGFWKSFDEADGLIALDVHSIIQDRDGYLWFGTEKGVNRYDG